MDSLITAAAHALAAGDPLGALKRVALRNDAPALALRGIAMAQLGDLVRAKALLRRAARAFGPKEAVARARCIVAEAEIALVSRDLDLARESARCGAGGARAARRPGERGARAASRGPAASADRASRRGRARADEVRCRALAAGIAGRPRTGGRGGRDAALADTRRHARRSSRLSEPRVRRAFLR